MGKNNCAWEKESSGHRLTANANLLCKLTEPLDDVDYTGVYTRH